MATVNTYCAMTTRFKLIKGLKDATREAGAELGFSRRWGGQFSKIIEKKNFFFENFEKKKDKNPVSGNFLDWKTLTKKCVFWRKLPSKLAYIGAFRKTLGWSTKKCWHEIIPKGLYPFQIIS